MTVHIGLSMNVAEPEGERLRAYVDLAYIEPLQAVRVEAVPLLPSVDEQQIERYLDEVDGVVFTGGYDLSPDLWQEQPHPSMRLLHPLRQRCEMRLMRAVLRRGIPMLGICLGLQMLNVIRGGSLHQYLPDVPGMMDHRSQEGPGRHELRLHPDGRLAGWLGDQQVVVNSAHQQGINRVGEGLIVSASAPDGLPEVLEMKGRSFCVAVQWHPEIDFQEGINAVLWEKFLAAAKKHD